MTLRRAGLPDDAVELIEQDLAHWRRLTGDEQDRLLELADWLLRRKHWEASAGFRIDDRIRVLIATQAALLILGLSPDHYRLVSSIIVYPSSVLASGERPGPVAGTRTDGAPSSSHGMRPRHRPAIRSEGTTSSSTSSLTRSTCSTGSSTAPRRSAAPR
jgi:hypothetical protein